MLLTLEHLFLSPYQILAEFNAFKYYYNDDKSFKLSMGGIFEINIIGLSYDLGYNQC